VPPLKIASCASDVRVPELLITTPEVREESTIEEKVAVPVKFEAPVTARVAPILVAPERVDAPETLSELALSVPEVKSPVVVVPRVTEFEVVAPLEVTLSRVELLLTVKVPDDEAIEVSVPPVSVAGPTMPFKLVARAGGGTETEIVGELGLVLSTVTLFPATIEFTKLGAWIEATVNLPVKTVSPSTVNLPLIFVSVLSSRKISG